MSEPLANIEKNTTMDKEIKELNNIELELIKSNKQDDLPADLFENYLTKRADILKHFGLPDTTDYTELLEFGKRKLTQKEIKDTIDRLHNAAKKYLLRPVLTDEQILKDAQEQKKSPYRVLPELGINPHTYTIFVYNEFLLKDRDTIENILRTLRLANRDDILAHLGNIENGDSATQPETIIELQKIGILYLDEFKEHAKQNVYNTVNELLHALTPEYSMDNLEEKFDEIAYYLMNYTVLDINLKPYRITELEIYYHNPKLHPDPYVHKHPYQLANAQWYFHGSGLDITFGDREKGIYAGVLIRGIKDLTREQWLMKIIEKGKINKEGIKQVMKDIYIDGPLNVVTEIFRTMGHVKKGRHYFYLAQFDPGSCEERPTKAPRVGLKSKKEDKHNFKNAPLRYIVEIDNPYHKFPEKIKVAKQLLETGQFSKDEINKKFGFKIV